MGACVGGWRVYVCIVSCRNESCHMRMSHVTYECHTGVRGFVRVRVCVRVCVRVWVGDMCDMTHSCEMTHSCMNISISCSI